MKNKNDGKDWSPVDKNDGKVFRPVEESDLGSAVFLDQDLSKGVNFYLLALGRHLAKIGFQGGDRIVFRIRVSALTAGLKVRSELRRVEKPKGKP